MKTQQVGRIQHFCFPIPVLILHSGGIEKQERKKRKRKRKRKKKKSYTTKRIHQSITIMDVIGVLFAAGNSLRCTCSLVDASGSPTLLPASISFFLSSSLANFFLLLNSPNLPLKYRIASLTNVGSSLLCLKQSIIATTLVSLLR